MGIKFVFLLISAFTIKISTSPLVKHDPLVNTKWKFIGYVYKENNDSIEYPPGGIIYTIEFHKRNRVTGIAAYSYTGRYKLKGSYKVLIRPNISKKYYPNDSTQKEFDWRIRFSHDLVAKEPYLFSIKNDDLEIYCGKSLVMLFNRIK